jgi:hypothetical protein
VRRAALITCYIVIVMPMIIFGFSRVPSIKETFHPVEIAIFVCIGSLLSVVLSNKKQV